MIKLELNEVIVLKQLLESSQFTGKDAQVIADLLNKLNKELEKLMPKKGESFGQK
tara:strand:- start:872 stop:1036 length:165 start_codon:yes stop_codon:yes gene_type:complete